MKRFLFGILLGTILGGGAVRATYYDIDDVMNKLDDIEAYALNTNDLMLWCGE